MINFNTIFLFFEFIVYISGQNQFWNFENSSIDLLSSDSDTYQNIIYDETKNGYRLKLEKYMYRKNDQIIQKNYIQINNDDKKEVKWEDIYNFFPLKDKLFICPKGKNHLSTYSQNGIMQSIYPKDDIIGDWELTCFNYKNRILLSYLGSDDVNLYSLNIDDGEWESLPMFSGYFDILWPSKEINDDNFYLTAILMNTSQIILGRINTTVKNKTTSNYEGDKYYINFSEDKKKAFFDENKHFYWISYNVDSLYFFQSGYSITSMPDNIEEISNYYNYIRATINGNTPFKIFENIKINYMKLFRNTKYAYYELNQNELIYHGIIDIELNQIVFNTNETILEFKPHSKYSFMAITTSSAYEICINGKLDEKCIDNCPPGQKLIIDNEKGNYCEGTEQCKKYIFKPNNTCTYNCDESINTLIEEKECGLCKYLNKSFPYKIKGEDSCIKEKPNNTYFVDESSYILKNCHSSCETCNGGNDNQCLSCINSILFEGQCIKECPTGYYEDKKRNECLECNTNCLTCSEGKENSNNHCSSCPNNNYLVTAKGMDNNCVEQCPKNTITNNSTWECEDGNDNMDDKDNKEDKDDKNGKDDTNNKDGKNDGKKDKKSKNENSKLIVWFLIVIIIILIVIIIIILLRKLTSSKKEDEVNVILKSEEDNFMLQRNNDSFSQETEN